MLVFMSYEFTVVSYEKGTTVFFAVQSKVTSFHVWYTKLGFDGAETTVFKHVEDVKVNNGIDLRFLNISNTLHFIALIHPIQWTIANPVGADRPAKRQKKTSCVTTGWPVRSTVHSPDGASYFLPV